MKNTRVGSDEATLVLMSSTNENPRVCAPGARIRLFKCLSEERLDGVNFRLLAVSTEAVLRAHVERYNAKLTPRVYTGDILPRYVRTIDAISLGFTPRALDSI